MQYLLTFLEGVISFISPCLLPMLPVYISYFAGEGGGDGNRRVWPRALAFVLGFTVVFVALGLFAGALGSLLRKYQMVFQIVCGLIVVILGLSFLGVIRIPLFSGGKAGREIAVRGVISAFLFGLVFSISWTPCVGAFLGSALMLASQQASVWQGLLLLLCYSLGLGIPFLVSAVLIGKLKTAFDFIKRHYKTINLISGIFLILMGILMMTGLLARLLSLLS